MTIRWAVVPTTPGGMLVAATGRGGCRPSLNEGPGELRRRFPQGGLGGGGAAYAKRPGAGVGGVGAPLVAVARKPRERATSVALGQVVHERDALGVDRELIGDERQRIAARTVAQEDRLEAGLVALLIVGAAFLVHGLLIVRSTFLPKVLGVLIQIAGVGYLLNGFTLFVAPTFAGQVFLVIMLPVLVGETSLSLWLLVKGVNAERWHLVSSRARPGHVATVGEMNL